MCFGSQWTLVNYAAEQAGSHGGQGGQCGRGGVGGQHSRVDWGSGWLENSFTLAFLASQDTLEVMLFSVHLLTF